MYTSPTSYYSQCLNGNVTCFEDYVPETSGNLTSSQLQLLKSEILQAFNFQFNHDEHVLIDIRVIHQHPSEGMCHYHIANYVATLMQHTASYKLPNSIACCSLNNSIMHAVQYSITCFGLCMLIFVMMQLKIHSYTNLTNIPLLGGVNCIIVDWCPKKLT